ncbi:hexokinase [Besnoitia besnoiti]|uniref:Phosphotransferase n=1 Tax=Besnoitia besnoiti TaxID=94643 RepID=A0A2A9MK85_BESBE|nr:hexokinase [Besnoitia besnoiti]PFH36681.1 hexokinase [Besnoitia besnoiti]
MQPRQPGDEAKQQAALEAVRKMMTPTKEVLQQLQQSFLAEIQRGLAMHKKHGIKWVPEECSMKMLDSCVSHLPTGAEVGEAYAIDFGGSTCRAVRCCLIGGGKMTVEQDKVCLRSAEHRCAKGFMDKQAGGKELFDQFAKCVRGLMERSGDLKKAEDEKKLLSVGFTFSFPCAQAALNSSFLIEWTKGFETGRENPDRVEGKDVAVLLAEALERANVPAVCKAVVNDTVGTLVSCAYQREPGAPECCVGMIVGTGFNACYVEPEAGDYGYTGTIVNMEAGNFNKELPRNEIDVEVDDKTHNRGKQQFEKLISGYYIGEIVRVAAVKVFGDRAPAKSSVRHSIHGEVASLIRDDLSEDKAASIKAMQECWDATMDIEDIKCMWEICRLVFDRSAAFAATLAVTLCSRSGRLESGATVGIDGALYVKNRWYRECVDYYTTLLAGELANNITYCIADDGSGKGAALIADVA